MNPDNKLPIHVVQAGPVRAAIWIRAGQGSLYYEVNLWRCGGALNDWRRTDTFTVSEIAWAAAALLGAHLWVLQRRWSHAGKEWEN